MASLWQQAGRAGRTGRPSLTLVLAQDSPLELYFASHPAALLARPIEAAAANPLNAELLQLHLLAAAQEQPLRLPPPPGDAETEPELCTWGEWKEPATAAIKARELKMVGSRHNPRLECSELGAAAVRRISLREICREKVRVVDVTEGAMAVELETMEAAAAQLRLYSGAVFLHCGASYLVSDCDLDAGLVRVRREDTSYYTEPRDHTRVAIMGITRTLQPAGCTSQPAAAEPAPAVDPASEPVAAPPSTALATAALATAALATPAPPAASVSPAALAAPTQPAAPAAPAAPATTTVPASAVHFGPMRVSKSVYGYRQKAKLTGKLLDKCELDQPMKPHSFDTCGLTLDPQTSSTPP